MPTDPFHGFPNDPSYSAGDCIAVTPHDTNDLVAITSGISFGTAGNLTIITPNGRTVTIPGLAAGVIHPIRAKRIKATGTAASGIVAYFPNPGDAGPV
jgi:hypothetical protein